MAITNLIDSGRPLFSVLIPAFRAAKYLRETLDSVAAQTVTSWEIRIHEDGILDHTAEIVRSFALLNPGRVHLTRAKVNQGVSRARNHLMKEAEGAFIAFLDADDIWSPDHLEAALKVHLQNSADWVISGYDFADADGIRMGRRFVPPPRPSAEIPDALLKESYILPSAVSVRRESVWGIQFDSNLSIGEDLDFWIQLCQRPLVVGYTHKATIVYRKHGTSATANQLRFIEQFSVALLKQTGRSLVDQAVLVRQIVPMLNTVIQMTWRREPARARRALRRLQTVRSWNPSAWIRVGISFFRGSSQNALSDG